MAAGSSRVWSLRKKGPKTKNRATPKRLMRSTLNVMRKDLARRGERYAQTTSPMMVGKMRSPLTHIGNGN